MFLSPDPNGDLLNWLTNLKKKFNQPCDNDKLARIMHPHLLANLEHKKWLDFIRPGKSSLILQGLFKLLPPLDMIYGVKTSTMLLLIHLLRTICGKPPPSSWVKVNFDGSVKNNNIAAMEFVIRDDHNSSLFAGTKNLGWTNVLSIQPLLVDKLYLKLSEKATWKFLLKETWRS